MLANVLRTMGMLVIGVWTVTRVMSQMTSLERLKEYIEFDDHEEEWECKDVDKKIVCGATAISETNPCTSAEPALVPV